MDPRQLLHHLDQVVRCGLSLHPAAVVVLKVCHHLLHLGPADVQETLNQVPVDEAGGRFCLPLRVKGPPEGVLDLAHAFDDFIEPVLHVQQEVVPALGQGGDQPNHAVDRAEEHGALRGRGRLAEVLHDQGAVAEDVDELAQVEEPDLLEVLPLLVGGGSAVLLTHEQVKGVLSSQEIVIVQDFHSAHPVGVKVPRNLLEVALHGLVGEQQHGAHEVAHQDEVALGLQVERHDVVVVVTLSAQLLLRKDKLIAVFDEQEPLHKIESPGGNPAGRQSPDAFETEVAAQLAAFKPVGGEIEVTPSALKLGTPLLVRRSSDPAPGPPADAQPTASHTSGQSLKPAIPDSTQNLEDGEVMNGVQTELLTSPKIKDALSDMTRTVEISAEGGPLGIHVVPFFSSLSGRILGLFIRGIEENSRSKREGLFQENECIVKINHVDLADKTFVQAQDVFRQAMKAPCVLLHVLPPQNREQYEKSVIGPLNIFGNNDGVSRTKPPPPVHPRSGIKTVSLTGASSPEEDGSPSLQQSKSPRVPRIGRKPSSPSLSPLMGFGSKKNAKKIKIDLKKGPEGLGFTVVTRDSSIHGPGPIFVKNILPKGAAIKDGRLQSGDRILEVNGRDVTGRTQEELVAMLRSTKQGETASLVIARQEGAFLPRELKGEPDCRALSPETTDQLTFEIPLNDSGSAGLGVSLKGNKSRETGTDMGIFIKSVIHGGAAFKDGRLRMNDQLIAVNGESLLGKSNHEAMETLRRSMSMEGNIRGMIQLVILRRPERPMEEPGECGAFSKPCSENCHSAVATCRRSEDGTWHPLSTYCPHHKQREPLLPSDGWAESEVPPSPSPLPVLELGLEDYSHSSGMDPAVYFPDQHSNFRSVTPARQPESMSLKASKSMDLVPDESKVHSLAGHKLESSSKDFGPTLGLKKSSSLESLQTAVAEVRKNELPFHRPRPHMVRGRGCNESFRTAIDKSYDGPEDLDDGLSDRSSHSGHGALNCDSAPPGNSEPEDLENKARKAKKTKEKEKKKEKGKAKGKEKKQKEESEDPERKIKRKGLGAMLRFGKKKDEKSGKAEQKGPVKHGGLREEELEKMKEERERIGAKHQELREKQARGLVDYATGTTGSLHDMDDDEMDPNYARVNHFREPCASANVYRSPSPPRAGPLVYPRDGRPLSPERDHLEGLYAKVNKPYHPPV